MAISKDIEFNLREKLYIINRRKWVLIASVVIIFTVVTIGNFTTTPLYRASTRLRIEPQMPNIVPFKQLYSISGRQLDYYNTQYKILKSRSLSKKVMKSLPPDKTGELTAGALLRMVTIKPIAQSQLVDIMVVSPDPELAALIANTWGDQFIRLTIESKLKAIQAALSQLTHQLEEQNENVNSARKKLLDYKERERIVSLEDVQKELERLTEAYSTTKQEREEKELQLKHLRKYSDRGVSLETFPEVRYHSIIMQIKNRLVRLQSTLAEYSQRYKSKHPKMLQLRAEIQNGEESLKKEISKIVQSLVTEHELAMANEARILAELEKQKTLAFNMERKLAAIDDLDTKVTIKREGQQALLSRVNETSMTKGIEITNILVVDEAETPVNPFKPRKLFNIVLSLIIGTAGGIGAIFLIESLDSSIKTSIDARRTLKLPFLGPIPLYSQIHVRAGTSPLEIIKNQSGLIPEAFRTIRTGIYFSSADHSPRIILVTSSMPQEGKTDISTQLSAVMAQSNEKVLLIDGDMRKPRLGKIFGANNRSKGFSSLLCGDAEIDEVIQQTIIPGLDIIPCGIIPPNPSELINSPRFREILTIAGKQWDRVILDSPPILSVTDATIMSRSVDGVIMVVRAGSTSGKIAVFCREKLDHVQAHFIGVILNRADINRGDDYYYYYANYYNT